MKTWQRRNASHPTFNREKFILAKHFNWKIFHHETADLLKNAFKAISLRSMQSAKRPITFIYFSLEIKYRN